MRISKRLGYDVHVQVQEEALTGKMYVSERFDRFAIAHYCSRVCLLWPSHSLGFQFCILMNFVLTRFHKFYLQL